MRKDGRPYTNENGYADSSLITDKDAETIRQVGEWIRNNILAAKGVNEHTSYGLKHMLENDTGIYLTNNEFKDAMLLAGFPPVDENELNWRYRIEMVSEVIRNPSPFVAFVKGMRDLSGREDDFRRDMTYDREFPVFADRDIILRYLKDSAACAGAVEAFKRLWKEYQSA